MFVNTYIYLKLIPSYCYPPSSIALTISDKHIYTFLTIHIKKSPLGIIQVYNICKIEHMNFNTLKDLAFKEHDKHYNN